MTKISHGLRKRFTKDYRLPIVLFQDPYFEYFINMYSHMNAKDKYQQFVELVEKLGEQEFFAESSRIIEEMNQSVKSNPAYKRFIEFDMNEYVTQHIFGKASKVFNDQNDGVWFTSIDLIKANWQCLSALDRDIFGGAHSYEDWARNFTSETYYLKSKQIRQVVFGGLNPKRQQVLQRYMMDKVWLELEKLNIDVFGATSDEIIVRHDQKPDKLTLDSIKDSLPSNLDLHFQTYKLVQIDNRSYFKREYLDGTFDLKGVPAQYYPEVLRYVRGEDSTEMDRTSFHEGRVVRFVEPLFSK